MQCIWSMPTCQLLLVHSNKCALPLLFKNPKKNFHDFSIEIRFFLTELSLVREYAMTQQTVMSTNVLDNNDS